MESTTCSWCRTTILIDSVSTHDFISEDFVKRHNLATTSGPDDIRITLADGSTTSRQEVEEGSQPPSRPAYRLSKPQIDELQAQLKHGFIEPSRSPYGAPVFFVVKKTDGSLRMV